MRLKHGWPFTVLFALLVWACSPTKKLAGPAPVAAEKLTPMPVADSFFTALFQRHPALFDSVLLPDNPHSIQIIYTQIDRDSLNQPHFKSFYYNRSPGTYFYPASTVKMPVAFLALQKLNELNTAGLDRNTTMITRAADKSQTAVYNDPTTADGRPTIGHYIKKIFLVSDNDAYNRLYEFLGQEYVNNTLHGMGYDSVQLLHRLSVPLNDAQNRLTNPVAFYDDSGKLVYEKPLQQSQLTYQMRQTRLGKGYMSRGKLIEEPFDFSVKNRFALQDLHDVLRSVIFPEATPVQKRFNLKEEDYLFLYRWMGSKPSESLYPSYDKEHYPDAYVKFLMYGGSGPMPDANIRIFNKVGDAYGFLTDVAYIVDFANGVEFMLSATIYCNSDGIFNDDKYDYETIGFPFLRNLGRVIYAQERRRVKAFKPDLSKFQKAVQQPL
jgi:hypothetical protein